MDILKSINNQIGGKLRPLLQSNYNLDVKSVRTLSNISYRNHKISIDDYGKLFLLNIKIDSQVSFSINNPDELFRYRKPVDIDILPYQIYVIDDKHSKEIKSLPHAFLEQFGELLKGLNFSDRESIFLYKNCVSVVLANSRDMVRIIDMLLDFIDSFSYLLNQKLANNLSYKDLPEILKSLIPLLKKYSLTDDEERVELIENLSMDEKKNIVSLVMPLISKINHFLNSFDERPLTEVAIQVGNLAEFATEINNGSS